MPIKRDQSWLLCFFLACFFGGPFHEVEKNPSTSIKLKINLSGFAVAAEGCMSLVKQIISGLPSLPLETTFIA